MPKVERLGLQPVYSAAEQFVERAIINDDSVFTPGTAVWTVANLRHFHRLFIEHEDTSSNSFNVKLQSQLAEAPADVAQLAAEMMFFHSLGVSNQGLVSKRKMIVPLLESHGRTFPAEFNAALEHGIANHGAGLSHRDAYVRCLTRFMLAVKEMPVAERRALCGDGRALRELVFGLQADADSAQRHMLVHLIRPEQFEPMALAAAKDDIIKTFSEFVSDPTANVDDQLADIREALSGRYGDNFNFYDDALKRQWGEASLPADDDSSVDPVDQLDRLVTGAFPDDGLRQLLLALLADAIEVAHAAGPSAWGVRADTGRLWINLNVGRLATFRISADEVSVALDRQSLSPDVVEQLEEAATKTGVYDSLPGSTWWNMHPDRLPALLDEIRVAFDNHIRHAATAVRVTPYARSHSTAVIEYLSGAVGRDLPHPTRRDLPSTSGSGWDGLVHWAAVIYEHEQFEQEERDHKLVIGKRLQDARNAVLGDEPGWADALQIAFTRGNNLTPWQSHAKFYGWAHEQPTAARVALEAIWNSELSPAMRIERFCEALPLDVVSGVGTRLAIASFLLMADPTELPIFRISPFHEAWRLAGWEAPGPDATESELYTAALEFMDELRRRLADVGVDIRDRLDAQGLIWSVCWRDPPEYLSGADRDGLARFKTGRPQVDTTGEETTVVTDDRYCEPSFDEIVETFAAAGFRIDSETLHRYHLSLKTRGFVILSGVSGTGKSWLTRLYAEAVGGEFCLVPVAPNWTTNEDLLGYHNPVSDAYVDTEFTRFVRRAVEAQTEADTAGEPARPFFVVLDEMNLARVEYYLAKFLSVMEAREHAKLELSEAEQLALPRNLYAIGTVNVDETTHGFADKVYDRAQVIELPISEADIVDFVRGDDHGARLLEVWRAVRDVAPFAYRVVDETRSYVAAAVDDGLDWQTALDHQVLQKVLPKLARVDERVGSALQALIDLCADTMPLSRAKAEQMRRNLESHGFASYF